MKLEWRIISLILLALLIFQCNRNKRLTQELSINNQITDTVYVNKYYEIPKAYPVPQVPKIITFFKRDTVSTVFKEIIVKRDTLILYNEIDSFEISKWFLLQYPEAMKLISLELTSKNLTLDLLDRDGIFSSREFQIDSRYKYRYIGNQLTFEKQKTLKLNPSLEYQYRPLNNMHDLNILLNLKTTKFIYKAGVNLYEYKTFGSGLDLMFGLTFNF